MRRLLLTLILSFLATQAFAADFALGIHGGTPGIGVDAIISLSEKVNLRGRASYFETDLDENEDGVNYKLDLELGSFGALIDWHPLGGNFRISAGLFANANELNGSGRGEPGTQVEYGGQNFNADDIGTVNASIEFNGIAPYIGVGWGNATSDRKWALMGDVGIFFQGEPDVALSTPEVNPAIALLVEAERAQAEAELQDDVDSLEFYPYLSFGVAFKL